MIRPSFLIPVFFMVFLAVGLSQPKTLLVASAFSVAMVLGISRGDQIEWRDEGIPIEERHVLWAFWASILIVIIQIIMVKSVPLLNPSVRTLLNPRLTAITYFLGVPSSIYLFLRGKKYSLVYPAAVALYAYRTPVVVSLLGIGIAYYESSGGLKKIRRWYVLGLVALLLGMGLLVTVMRGESLSTLAVRVQATTSALDVIVWRAGWKGLYHGQLQWSGVASYITGGYSPRGLIARFLYVKDVTVTATLMGGMYLDFGVFSIVEGFLLGVYYGLIQNSRTVLSKSIYYSTLAYGLVGIETGILDLPVYMLFIIGIYIVVRGTLLRGLNVKKSETW
ncbi:hypothetical protein E3E36_09265 [Thermococcus sp. M36]|uniref:hypothetical protein n=1 Tax=Thermococcus sp. M36 TaxID=1638261 RepID=UPI001438EA4B|nr:hypothetical protein [Thermococcus sp. M36]NJE06328.1 hypothetical protein [Thermococcus sp. M36]